MPDLNLTDDQRVDLWKAFAGEFCGGYFSGPGDSHWTAGVDRVAAALAPMLDYLYAEAVEDRDKARAIAVELEQQLGEIQHRLGEIAIDRERRDVDEFSGESVTAFRTAEECLAVVEDITDPIPSESFAPARRFKENAEDLNTAPDVQETVNPAAAPPVNIEERPEDTARRFACELTAIDQTLREAGASYVPLTGAEGVRQLARSWRQTLSLLDQERGETARARGDGEEIGGFGMGDLADMLDEVLRHVTALPSNMRYRSRLTARQAVVKAKTARAVANDRPAGNVSASKYARTGPKPVSLRDQSRSWLREFQEARREFEERATLRDIMAAAYRNGLGLNLDEDVWQRDDHDEEWKHREWSITNAHRREVGRLAIDTGDSFRRIVLSDRRGGFAPVTLVDPTAGEVLAAARLAGLITK
jgi:hypothetical protein